MTEFIFFNFLMAVLLIAEFFEMMNPAEPGPYLLSFLMLSLLLYKLQRLSVIEWLLHKCDLPGIPNKPRM